MDSLKEKPTLSDKDSVGQQVERLNKSNCSAEHSTVDNEYMNPEAAEKRVVGSALRFGSKVALATEAKHFFSPILGLIFSYAIASCDDANFNEELTAERLDAAGKLRAIGGLARISELSIFHACLIPDVTEYWATKVTRAWYRRESMLLVSQALESFRGGECADEVWNAIGVGYRELRGDCDI